MNSNVTVTFNMAQFQRTLRDYVQRRAPEKRARALNTKAYQLAWLAAQYTKVASRAAIEELFAVARKIVRSRKTGRTKQGRVVVGNETIALRIYIANQRRAGKPIGDSAAEIDAGARRMVTKRLSGIGSVRAGWVPAIKRLIGASDLKLGQPADASLRGGGDKGYGIRATARNPMAEIANGMDSLRKPSVFGIAEAGLRRAFAEVNRDMEQYLIRKEIEAAREAGIEAHS